jgi:hypothetical protein
VDGVKGRGTVSCLHLRVHGGRRVGHRTRGDDVETAAGVVQTLGPFATDPTGRRLSGYDVPPAGAPHATWPWAPRLRRLCAVTRLRPSLALIAPVRPCGAPGRRFAHGSVADEAWRSACGSRRDDGGGRGAGGREEAGGVPVEGGGTDEDGGGGGAGGREACLCRASDAGWRRGDCGRGGADARTVCDGPARTAVVRVRRASGGSSPCDVAMGSSPTTALRSHQVAPVPRSHRSRPPLRGSRQAIRAWVGRR